MHKGLFRACLFSFASSLTLSLVLAAPLRAQENDIVNPAPKPADWAALAALPDLSGVWLPDVKDQHEQETSNPPPWTTSVKARITQMVKDDDEGRPHGLFVNCLPQGMPTVVAITHNAVEFLVTPGRVTIVGELDGNSLRRIFTDGRKHPEDPDPSFSGHSVGRWENGTLFVDTVAIHPEVMVAITESAGVPNNGDMHITERWHLASPNVLVNDMEVTAPKILTGTWKTTRKFFRKRDRTFDFVAGVCLEGNFDPQTDKDGNAVFVPRKYSFSE